MEVLSLIQGLRFIDTFFPSGGYAFSSGLEAAVQGGAVRNAHDLDGYVRDFLEFGLVGRDGVAVGIAHQAVGLDNLAGVVRLDLELDAMKTCLQTRLASRQMGYQIIRVSAERDDAPTILAAYRNEVESGRSPGHLPVSMGLTLGACGWTKEQAVGAFLYQSAVGMVSAAQKLLPVGQGEAQRLLRAWSPLMATLSGMGGVASVLSSWSPIQDIYAMRQGGLAVRLFRS